MSSSRQRPFKHGKTPIPASAHPDVASHSVPPNNRYSLNLKLPSKTPSPSAYQVPEPKKIGRVKLLDLPQSTHI